MNKHQALEVFYGKLARMGIYKPSSSFDCDFYTYITINDEGIYWTPEIIQLNFKLKKYTSYPQVYSINSGSEIVQRELRIMRNKGCVIDYYKCLAYKDSVISIIDSKIKEICEYINDTTRAIKYDEMLFRASFPSKTFR